MRQSAYRVCVILATIALGISTGCSKTKKPEGNSCEDYCEKGIECVPDENTAAKKQACVSYCDDAGTPVMQCRVDCNPDQMCTMWVACLDLCTGDETDLDSGSPDDDAGAGDGGTAGAALCEGYTLVGDKDMDRCCRVTNPCEWNGDFVCDCLGTCAWEGDDCDVDAG